MAEIAIGIDLGTSNSCVAVVRRGAPEVLPNAFGEPTSASVVTFQQDGSALVGNAAKANLIHDPRNTVCSAKRLIGRYFFSEEVRKAQAVSAYEIVETDNHGVRVGVRSESISLPEISAMVLREMKSIAEANLGQEIHQAVITVPAYFNDNQRQATRDAGRIAGLEVLRLLNEPTAAALAYGFGRGLNQKVAVYDLGGGTFDISILEIGEDVYEVLSTYGDTFLGGDDFDDRLIDLLAEEFLAQEGINLRKDPFALEKLKLAAESAKKGLSVEDEVEIRIPDVIAREDGKACSIVRAITTQEYLTLVATRLCSRRASPFATSTVSSWWADPLVSRRYARPWPSTSSSSPSSTSTPIRSSPWEQRSTRLRWWAAMKRPKDRCSWTSRRSHSASAWRAASPRR
jgi:molecular chaperone DnaK